MASWKHPPPKPPTKQSKAAAETAACLAERAPKQPASRNTLRIRGRPARRARTKRCCARAGRRQVLRDESDRLRRGSRRGERHSRQFRRKGARGKFPIRLSK